MTKKDIMEVRKTVKGKGLCIHTIHLCYAAPDREKLFFAKHGLQTLPEDDIDAYCEIFKKTLGGKPEKNLVTMDFSGENSCMSQEELTALVKGGGKNADAAENLCEEFIQGLNMAGNYLIILAYGSYDIPAARDSGMAADGISESVYEFMLCSICPVEPSERGLFYHPDKKDFAGKITDKILRKPVCGFLYPAFEGRMPDIHHLLYCMPKPKEAHPEFAEDILGCRLPQEADDQKETFRSVVADALGKNATVESLVEVNRGISEYKEERDMNEEPAEVGKLELQRILKRAGASEDLDEDINVMAENIVEDRYVFEASGIKISVSPEHIDRIRQESVGGAPCIVIPASGMTLNGIDIRVS